MTQTEEPKDAEYRRWKLAEVARVADEMADDEWHDDDTDKIHHNHPSGLPLAKTDSWEDVDR